jgi:hypothetical protein
MPEGFLGVNLSIPDAKQSCTRHFLRAPSSRCVSALRVIGPKLTWTMGGKLIAQNRES